MNVSSYGRQPNQSPVDRRADDLVATYVSALVAGDARTALTTLSADAVLRSPFHTWRARHLPSVFRARCVAFAGVRIDTVISGGDSSAVLWRAGVNGARVQAAELIFTGDGAIRRIDVFLRPAGVLDAVERAMVNAWPRRSEPGGADPGGRRSGPRELRADGAPGMRSFERIE